MCIVLPGASECNIAKGDGVGHFLNCIVGRPVVDGMYLPVCNCSVATCSLSLCLFALSQRGMLVCSRVFFSASSTSLYVALLLLSSMSLSYWRMASLRETFDRLRLMEMAPTKQPSTYTTNHKIDTRTNVFNRILSHVSMFAWRLTTCKSEYFNAVSDVCVVACNSTRLSLIGDRFATRTKIVESLSEGICRMPEPKWVHVMRREVSCELNCSTLYSVIAESSKWILMQMPHTSDIPTRQQLTYINKIAHSRLLD